MRKDNEEIAVFSHREVITALYKTYPDRFPGLRAVGSDTTASMTVSMEANHDTYRIMWVRS